MMLYLINTYFFAACVRLSYNGDKAALTVTFIVNEKVVFSKTVSGKYWCELKPFLVNKYPKR